MENPLPPKYYLTNFKYLIDFVVEKYASILNQTEHDFIQKINSLTEDELCWYLRFANRKGQFFKTQGLGYEELPDLGICYLPLIQKGFLVPLDAHMHAEHMIEVLQILTKPELAAIFKLSGSLKKEDLVEKISETIAPHDILKEIIKKVPVVQQAYTQEMAFLKFLFFGNRYLDMTEFVLADLGLIQYHKINQDSMVARFNNRQEAEDKWYISDQFLVFQEMKKNLTSSQVFDWFMVLKSQIKNLSSIAVPAWEKLQLNIGKYLEQQKELEKAIEIYKDLYPSPAREREIRCHEKLGNINTAKSLLEELREKPQNAQDEQFALFFLNKISKKKEKKISTLILNDAPEIYVPDSYKYQVEQGALAHYMNLHYEGNFSENFTWRSIFGLLFWDTIFDPSKVAFHHPFQRRPSDLHLPDFYQKRKQEIHEILDGITDNESLMYLLQKNYPIHFGKANPFVLWLDEIWHMSLLMASELPITGLKNVLVHMCKDISENTRGFPDLLVWNSQGLEFIEIKGPNDTLSSQQVFWIEKLKAEGINAKVVKVKFL